MADLIDNMKTGRFKFADAAEEARKRATTMSELTKRTIWELRGFADLLEKEHDYFNRMSAVEDKTILTQDQIKEFRERAYRLDTAIGYMRGLLDSNSRLAAILDHAKRATNELKGKGITTDEANNLMHRELVPSLRDAIKTCDESVKDLKKVLKEEEDILRQELAVRRLL